MPILRAALPTWRNLTKISVQMTRILLPLVHQFLPLVATSHFLIKSANAITIMMTSSEGNNYMTYVRCLLKGSGAEQRLVLCSRLKPHNCPKKALKKHVGTQELLPTRQSQKRPNDSLAR